MRKEMKLRCRVAPADQNGLYPCIAQMFDGTDFTVTCQKYDVLIQTDGVNFENEPSHLDGWILVMQEAEQGNLVSITLPQPADQHGRRVNVSKFDLQPRHATIDDFNPSKPAAE